MTKFNYQGSDLFGKYCKIKMNAKGEKHLFKCIGLLQSNAYMDVPVEPYHEKTLHDDIELVANVIHCGIDETKVIRVAMKDIEIIDDNPPLSFGDLKEGMWVWDDEEKWYMKIVFLFAPCKQYHFKGSFKVWADSCERSLDFVVFEENRFYRRQKEDK